jgi:branched-chain amino acid transport system permease protein
VTTVRVDDGGAAVALATSDADSDAGRRGRALGAPLQAGVGGALLVFVVFGLPAVLDGRWLQVMTSVAIYSIVTLGLGLLIGRAGMVSLSQFLQLAMGAWVALRLAYATDLPIPLLVLAAGLITGLIGALIGLPALRLSGLYLALVTLMAAGAITVVLKIAQFPNGGGGFFGNSAAGGASSRLARPAIATGNTAYFRYCVVVAGLMFLLALWHIRGKPGRAWAAIRQSQVTAVAAGVNTTLYRLWAFALASFMAGVAGALLAAASGGVNINQFPVQNSILLFAVVLMGGVYSLGGAVVAALLLRLLPALLDEWGVSTELLTILFGVGILQVLLTAPGGLVDQVPKDLANLARGLRNLVMPKAERAEVERVGAEPVEPPA